MLKKYSITPIIRINWDREPSGHAENPDNWIFSLKIGYFGSLKWKKISTNGYLQATCLFTYSHNTLQYGTRCDNR
jgi:hypothetical protein